MGDPVAGQEDDGRGRGVRPTPTDEIFLVGRRVDPAQVAGGLSVVRREMGIECIFIGEY